MNVVMISESSILSRRTLSSSYLTMVAKKLPMYYITRDGFMFLVMGFTGKTAAKWKEAYIKAFNEMEAKIRAEQMAKAIEEHDRKEAEEYEKLLEREDREEAAIDARVAAMPPAKSRK